MTQELEDYIIGHIDPQGPILDNIERQTNLRLLNGRMCSGTIQGRLLKMFVAMIKPRRILELGTFSGFSALCMAEGLEPGATIDTIEADDELAGFINENLAASPHGDMVTLHIGDALETMRRWQPGTFDLIFIDADKRDYDKYYEAALPLLTPGGFIIADNTLWDAHVLEVAPRSPQTLGIKRFNDLVAADPRVEKVIVPLRDGLTIIKCKS